MTDVQERLQWTNARKQIYRRGVRAAEGARLESVYTATYRGFESLPLRHIFNELALTSGVFIATFGVVWGCFGSEIATNRYLFFPHLAITFFPESPLSEGIHR